MRTKALICAAVLAAGAISAMADNVYSLNVVGYVNKTYVGGTFYMVTVPFNTTDNKLSSFLSAPPDGTAIYMYDCVSGDFTNNYNFNGGVWDNDAVVKPGQGLFLYTGGDFVNTYVGEVAQGAPTVEVAGGGLISIIGSPVPVSGPVETILTGYVPSEGDSVYKWNPDPTVQDIGGFYSYNGGAWSGDITSIDVAEGFLFFRTDPTTTWTRNFTVAP